MAIPICARCGVAGFRSVETEVTNYRFKLNAFCCRSCGAVAGFMPHYDPGVTGHNNGEAIKKLQQQVAQLSSELATVLQLLQRR